MNVRPGQRARVVLPKAPFVLGKENDGIIVMVGRLLAPGEKCAVRVGNDHSPVWHVTALSRPFQQFGLIEVQPDIVVVKKFGEIWNTNMPDSMLVPLPDDDEQKDVSETRELDIVR